jgi:hypothetical protein
MLETGNTTLMPVIQAFRVEIALRQGDIAIAGRWATHLDPISPLRPTPFNPGQSLAGSRYAYQSATGSRPVGYNKRVCGVYPQHAFFD